MLFRIKDREMLRKVSTIVIVIGGLVIAAILALTTIHSMNIARSSTEEAVHSVSVFYLEELAGRREQVLARNLSDSVEKMREAIELMDETDLSDSEHLHIFESRMKRLYALEKFAFVDENGLIYTSQGTQKNIDEYDFNHETISGPEISVKDLESPEKKVIIAIPVDNIPFQDHHFVACFMEIDITRLLEGLSIQEDADAATSSNLYHSNGTSLTGVVLEGQTEAQNLFSALGEAEFEDPGALQQMKLDFSEGKEGYISYRYNGEYESAYYLPVSGTDWILTYMIRDDIITDNITNISEGIIRRSVIQTIGIALIMATFFIILIIQNRRTSQLLFEKEKEDAANEAIKQELEERISLQDELLENEKRQRQQDAMITAMASDYRSVYYIDLDRDYGLCFRAEDGADEGIEQGGSFTFSEEFTKYAKNYIVEDDREKFLEFIDPQEIRRRLAKEALIACRYLTVKDGEERYEMLRMAGVRHIEDRDDHIVHAIGAGFSDVDHETREAFAQRKALADALSQAEAANAAKTSFLSSMSHEIRTPMNVIIGLDSIALKDEDVPERTREYLEKIGASARHLLDLINEVLDMRRIESGRMTLKYEEFSFQEMLEQVNTMINSQCQDKGLSYDCQINGLVDDRYIADEMKLKQVILNILGNAVKFTPAPGSVTFIIEPLPKFENKAPIRFIMKDTGIGMDEEFIPKVFDTFAQENADQADKGGSTGLGLAITRNIVEMMNGKITVQSKKGEGTTFTVTVTLKCAENRAGEEDSDEIRTQDMRVLIIDDDEIACRHAQLVLEEIGIPSETCTSGKKAYELIKLANARARAYNLILVDLKMPDEDGILVTKKIREMFDKESAIIMLTAFNWDDIIEEAINAGVDGFMAKPLFASNVLEAFRQAIKDKRIEIGEVHRADLNGKKVLLVEDMQTNAEIIKRMLDMRNMKVDHAENGKIAADMFERSSEGTYDAVLMDIRMPVMDGLQSAETIRSFDRQDSKEIPIIALTANAFDEDVQKSLQAGMNAHLTKPIEPERLYDVLERFIRD